MSQPESVRAAREAGLSLVPADLDKRPKVKWKQWQTERQTEDEFESLGHGSIWGVVTGELYGIVVLDFDYEYGGEESLEALGLTPHVKTPSGAHVYVRHPGWPVKNAVRQWDEYPGLDVRGDGGLAWFAGRGRKGKYEPVLWPPFPVELEPDLVELFFPHPQDTGSAAPRGTWKGKGQGTPEAVRYLKRAADDIRNAEPGTSNKALNKAAFTVGGLVASGQLDGEYAYETLYEAAVERGAGEPEDVIQAGLESGAEKPWKFTPDEDEWIPAITQRVFGDSGVPDPEPFPIEALPYPLDELVRQGSKSVSCPPDYIGAGVLPVLATAIGGYVELDITETWRESALVYTALVGKPGARKSPAMKIVMAPAREAQRSMFEHAMDQVDDDDASLFEVDPPQIIVDDATIEALFGLMEKNPRGLLMRADELKGWVKGMGQYKGGLGRDRQHWLSIWSREDIPVSRKTTKSHWIWRPYVSVLGGIQPDILEELLHDRDDGLLPRLLMAQGEFVIPKLQRNVVAPTVTEEYADLWNRLRDEGINARTVEFTEPGYRTFEAWVNEHYKSLAKIPGELAGAWSKMDAQLARITLILARVLDTEATPEVVERAVALVRYFQSQAGGLLQGSGSSSRWEKENAARQKLVGRYLLKNPGATRADLMANLPDWAKDARTLDRLLEGLSDWGIWNG